MTAAAHPRVSAARLDAIIRAVAEACGVSVTDILSHRSNARCVRARHLAMWLCRRVTSASYPQIAEAFDRDHSTVMHGVARTLALFSEDALLVSLATVLTARFECADD